ncbi:MAG: hypothetical protein Q8N23_28455 [Archangium sp.]|nr:hypothetical protein [Archangium sp.]MDP3156637.1 hypothetical protein [Archangium sp.]MDP3570578.1 hypothetical protein [Archangium sp.]
MEMLPAVLSSLVTAIPSLLVDVTLLSMAILRWNRHPRVSMLAAVSAVMLLLLDLLGRTVFAILPMKLHDSGRSTSDLGVIYAVLGGVSGLLHAVAMGLLVAAVFSDRVVSAAPERASFLER